MLGQQLRSGRRWRTRLQGEGAPEELGQQLVPLAAGALARPQVDHLRRRPSPPEPARQLAAQGGLAQARIGEHRRHARRPSREGALGLGQQQLQLLVPAQQRRRRVRLHLWIRALAPRPVRIRQHDVIGSPGRGRAGDREHVPGGRADEDPLRILRPRIAGRLGEQRARQARLPAGAGRDGDGADVEEQAPGEPPGQQRPGRRQRVHPGVVAGAVAERAHALLSGEVGHLAAEAAHRRLDVDGRGPLRLHEDERHGLPPTQPGPADDGAGTGASGSHQTRGRPLPGGRGERGGGESGGESGEAGRDEGGAQLPGVGEAVGGLLGQAAQDDLLHSRGERREPRGSGWPPRQVPVVDLVPIAGEGRPQRGHLVENGAQRVHVRAQIAVETGDALGGHVFGRSCADVRDRAARGATRSRPRQAQIHQPDADLAAGVADEEGVLRLEVAVADARRRQRGGALQQGTAHPLQDGQGGGRRPAGNLVSERASLQALHHEEAAPIDEGPPVVERRDVGRPYPRQRGRLPLHALSGGRVVGVAELDGDLPGGRLPGPGPDRPVAAPTDQAGDGVAGEAGRRRVRLLPLGDRGRPASVGGATTAAGNSPVAGRTVGHRLLDRAASAGTCTGVRRPSRSPPRPPG